MTHRQIRECEAPHIQTAESATASSLRWDARRSCIKSLLCHCGPSHYRVNVLVGVDPSALRVAHSFFVEAGEGSRIVEATPPIARLYS